MAEKAPTYNAKPATGSYANCINIDTVISTGSGSGNSPASQKSLPEPALIWYDFDARADKDAEDEESAAEKQAAATVDNEVEAEVAHSDEDNEQNAAVAAAEIAAPTSAIPAKAADPAPSETAHAEAMAPEAMHTEAMHRRPANSANGSGSNGNGAHSPNKSASNGKMVMLATAWHTPSICALHCAAAAILSATSID